MSPRSSFTLISAVIFFLASYLFAPAAEALIPIKIANVSYKDCPPELAEGNVTSGGNTMPASCFLITGEANNTSGKTLYDADVFGRIYDANNEPVLQNRTRLGALPEVPPGVTKFELRISVPANQPTPLQLKQFKATGFSTKVFPTF